MKNEAIRIAIPNCTVHKRSLFGKKGEHIRYTLTDGTGFTDGISFFGKENKEVQADQNQKLRAVVGQVETDTYRNKLRLRVLQCIA